MLVIRPIELQDLAALEALSADTGYGLTTLPRDTKLLARRIKASRHGFEKLTDDDRPRGETYLFVLEDLGTGRIVGTSGIVAKVGGFEPFYAYRIETTIHESKMLNVRSEIRVLHLDKEHDGPCEVGSLFLAPKYRHSGAGRLLSLCRFLFMAQFPEYFDPEVIAEMRGVVDPQGRSPFWDALGRHFFDIDYPTADYLSMVNKRFIADLMPKYPIYIRLLPPEAQAVVGKVHEQTEPAMRMLKDEGFRDSGRVDIFDGGPVTRCPLAEIRTVRTSLFAPISEIVDAPFEAEPYLICNARQDFRACQGPLQLLADGTVRIGIQQAMALKTKVGDSVRFATPRPVQVKPDGAHDTGCGSSLPPPVFRGRAGEGAIDQELASHEPPP
ncbi:MAG TPA: arginine N-succinyltransferase [Tepidisphaeraceae bacterium]|jgi:arginine N-succinyltransferase